MVRSKGHKGDEGRQSGCKGRRVDVKNVASKVCEYCGQIYVAVGRGVYSRKYCSDNCSYERDRSYQRSEDGAVKRRIWKGQLGVRNRLRELGRSESYRQQKRLYSQRRWQNTESRLQDHAKEYVDRSIRVGTLVRPSVCSLCGAIPGVDFSGRPKIEAHHFLGYAPEHWLDVQWLCVSCHKQADLAKVAVTS